MRTVAWRAISLLMLALVVFVLVMVPSSCSNTDNTSGETYTIGGVTQKGPFLTGSSVFIQELDILLVPTGLAYQTYTIDDQGNFALDSEIQSSLVEISIDGFYFNEVTGTLSDARITLKGLADLSQGADVNVNVLTTLSLDRTRALVGEGLSFQEASAQAQGEVLDLFGIDSDLVPSSFSQLDLSGAGVENATLLYVSALLQTGNSEAELSLLLADIGYDLETDGFVDNPVLKDEITRNAGLVDLQSVIDNLVGYYDDLGEVIDPPDVGTLILDLDETAPVVLATSVLDQALDVPVNSLFVVDFSEEVDLASVLDGGILLRDVMGGVVAGRFESAGSAVTFVPDSALAYDGQYELLIATTVTDLAGNMLAEPVTIFFTTEAEPDILAPFLTASVPYDGAVDVELDQTVLMTFSEELDSTTVISDHLWITDGTNLVASVIEPMGMSVKLTPLAPLAHETQYWIMATTGLTDLAGNQMDRDLTLTFSTKMAPLPPPPPVVEDLLIVSVTPEDGADGVSINRSVSVAFSERLDAGTLTDTSFKLVGPEGGVEGKLILNEDRITFVPRRHLLYGTRYEVRVLDIVAENGALHDDLEVFSFVTKDDDHEERGKHHDHDHDHDHDHGKD